MMRARLKGARKLNRDRVLANVSNADREILKKYRIEMFTVPGKTPQQYEFDDAFYVETLRFLREDWNELEEKTDIAEPSIEQMWTDVKTEFDKPRRMYLRDDGVIVMEA